MDKSFELSPEIDISFVSSGRPSVDHTYPSFYDSIDSGTSSRLSLIGSEMENRSSTSSSNPRSKHFMEICSPQREFSSSSIDSGKSWSSQNNSNMVKIISSYSSNYISLINWKHHRVNCIYTCHQRLI